MGMALPSANTPFQITMAAALTRLSSFPSRTQILALAGVLLCTADVMGHGTVTYPPSRVYNVYQANPSNPAFPLAANAVAIDGTLSYYTWNEVSRNIPSAVGAGLPPGFDYSPWMPDGELASAGRTDPFSPDYPRTYAGLDQVSADWPKTAVDAGQTITVEFLATAVHNPSVWDVWMTKPSWNPSMPLTWDQMEFLERPSPTLSGNIFTFDLAIPADRSGHHVLWVAWQRDDPVGEVFISTSDLDIQRTSAVFPGTGEDFQLASGSPGQLSSTPPADVKTTQPGQSWTVELSSPLGTLVGERALVVARLASSAHGLTPLFGTTEVYLDPLADRRVLQSASLSAGGTAWTFAVPALASGSTLLFQGITLSALTQNGQYGATDVHILHVLP